MGTVSHTNLSGSRDCVTHQLVRKSGLCNTLTCPEVGTVTHTNWSGSWGYVTHQVTRKWELCHTPEMRTV